VDCDSLAEVNLKAHADVVWVDLDGLLAQYAGWQGVYHIGPPFDGARKFMEDLTEKGKRLGFRVGVYTVRTNPDYPGREAVFDNHPEITTNEKLKIYLARIVEQWLIANRIAYSMVFIGNGKPIGIAYIDDRAVWCDPSKMQQSAWQSALTGIDLIMRKK
jgi:hypothetical protein